MTTVTASISNIRNTPGSGLSSGDPEVEFPGVYGNEDFAFTVSFSIEGGTISNVNIASFQDNRRVTVTKQGANLFLIEWKSSPFEDEFFDYIMKDYSEFRVPGTEAFTEVPKDSSIVEWIPPGTRNYTYQYTFSIEGDVDDGEGGGSSSVSITKTFSQDIEWNYVPSLAFLQLSVDQSLY